MMAELASRRCTPCRGDTPPLQAREVQTMLQDVPGWTTDAEGKLTRNIKLANFKEALALVNKIGDLAEQEGHHPDLTIHSWKRSISICGRSTSANPSSRTRRATSPGRIRQRPSGWVC